MQVETKRSSHQCGLITFLLLRVATTEGGGEEGWEKRGDSGRAREREWRERGNENENGDGEVLLLLLLLLAARVERRRLSRRGVLERASEPKDLQDDVALQMVRTLQRQQRRQRGRRKRGRWGRTTTEGRVVRRRRWIGSG